MQAKRSHPLLRSSQALALKIRGLPLMAMNDSRGIRIAVDPQKVEEELLWCFTQIQKDCKSLQDWIKAASSKGHRKRARQIQQGLEGEHIEKALAAIEIHGACSKVRWCPSRMCFKVWKVGEKPREFGVLDLNKKRKKCWLSGALRTTSPKPTSRPLPRASRPLSPRPSHTWRKLQHRLQQRLQHASNQTVLGLVPAPP